MLIALDVHTGWILLFTDENPMVGKKPVNTR